VRWRYTNQCSSPLEVGGLLAQKVGAAGADSDTGNVVAGTNALLDWLVENQASQESTTKRVTRSVEINNLVVGNSVGRNLDVGRLYG
jgi:hypothetical protein